MVREMVIVVLVFIGGLFFYEMMWEIWVFMGTMVEIQVVGIEDFLKIIVMVFVCIEEVEVSLFIWSEMSEILWFNEKGEVVFFQSVFEVVEKIFEIVWVFGGGFDLMFINNGYLWVEFFIESRFVCFFYGMMLDLGVVAKGFVVDWAFVELEGLVMGGLVDFGISSIVLFGSDGVIFEIWDLVGGLLLVTFCLSEGAIGLSSCD